jgi:hypothetical protein
MDTPLKKIIIISYFFPPSNFAGGYRIDFWAKNLNKYGYKPIIITRNWNNGQFELTDKIINNNYSHEVYDEYEVHRMPYRQSLRDKLNNYSNNKLLIVLRKSLSFFELILSNFSIYFIPYNNLYFKARKILCENKNQYHSLIISGRPFQSFYFGYLLSKEFNIKWIADYRDEWNSYENTIKHSFIEQIIKNLESKSEKKWVSNAVFFTTVSEQIVTLTKEFTNKNGFSVMNGYDPNEFNFDYQISKSNDEFNITYNGTLYNTQDISIFISAALKLIDDYLNQINIKISFIGISIDNNQTNRILKLISGYEKYFILTGRIAKKDVIKIEMQSDLLLIPAHTNIKGWYPSKIFEYFACKTPVLLCPSDSDVIEEFIIKSGCGVIANNADECYRVIKNMIEKKLNNVEVVYDFDIKYSSRFTRDNQTKNFAKILDSIELNN